jgi:predicted sulfurtransferase
MPLVSPRLTRTKVARAALLVSSLLWVAPSNSLIITSAAHRTAAAISSPLVLNNYYYNHQRPHATTTTRLSSVSPSSSYGPSAVRSLKPPLPTDATHLQMLSFYRFSPIENPSQVRDQLFEAIQTIPGLRGTIYLAPEGVNAQLAVPQLLLDRLLEECTCNLPFDPFELNAVNLGEVVDIVTTRTFDRLIVRTRDYVLRDGLDLLELDDQNENDAPLVGLDWNDAGSELTPAEWNDDLQQLYYSNKDDDQEELPLRLPLPTLLDCRNLYESDQGTFRGARPLQTNVFQESWKELDEMTKQIADKDQPLHIFCTGGIRCVKVGAYLKQKLGFRNVRRLEHGIIGYQQWWAREHYGEDGAAAAGNAEEASAWEGDNFLFDKRRQEEEHDDNNQGT